MSKLQALDELKKTLDQPPIKSNSGRVELIQSLTPLVAMSKMSPEIKQTLDIIESKFKAAGLEPKFRSCKAVAEGHALEVERLIRETVDKDELDGLMKDVVAGIAADGNKE